VIYSDEVRKIIDALSERAAKYIVRRWSDPKAQYQALRSSLHIGEFRNINFITHPAPLAFAAVFGFISTFLVAGICSFYVEEFKRFRFVNNRRRSLRVPLRQGSDLIAQDQTYPVTVFDLSERGARVQRGSALAWLNGPGNLNQRFAKPTMSL